MSTQLATVHGAELVDGRIAFGGLAPWRELSWRQRAWRFMRRPIEVFPGERLVYATRLHWCVPVKGATTHGGWVWPVAITVNGALSLLSIGLWFVQLGLWLAAVGHLFVACHKWIAWRTHLVVVTSERLLQVRGVLSTNLEDILLSEIRKVTVTQSWWEVPFGMGTLRIELAGDHDVGAKREYKKFIPDPWSVHRAIRQQVVVA